MFTILQPIFEWMINLVSSLGYPGIFFAMSIESAGFPMPSELVMGIAGFLVYSETMDIWLAGFAGALGNITGSSFIYFIGLKGGRPVIKKYAKSLQITEERFAKVEKWFSKWGDELVFFCQMIPIVRTFISLPAGILRINYLKFITYNFTGAFIWCTGLIYISSQLGEQWKRLGELIKYVEYALWIILVITCLYFIRKQIIYRRKKLSNT